MTRKEAEAPTVGRPPGRSRPLGPACQRSAGTATGRRRLSRPPAVRSGRNGNNGHDWYQSAFCDGLDESQVHTYWIDWRAERVSFSVVGRDAGTVWMDTKDAAHGGSNVLFGVMNQNDNTSITVYDMSYTPSGGDWW